MPADCIERVIGIGDSAQDAAALDDHLPGCLGLLRCEFVVDPWCFQHGRIEQSVRTGNAFVRQAIVFIRRFDQQHCERPSCLDAPQRPARQQNVVSFIKGKMTIVAEKPAAAAVHEQQLIAVRVAYQCRH